MINKHSNAQNWARDPPFPSDWDQETDWNALETADKANLEAPEQQVALEDFINSPEEPDYEAFAAEDNDTITSQARQEELQHYLDEQHFTEKFIRDAPFWRTCNVPSFSTPVEKAEISPNSYAANTVAFPELPTAAGKGDKWTPYAITDWLIRCVPVVHAGGLLYFYDYGGYLPYHRKEAKGKIMDICRFAVKAAGTASFVNQVYDLLLIEPRISRDENLNCSMVSFDDGVLDLDTGQFLPHSPELFVTTRLRASYRKGLRARCPNFQKFLQDISYGDDTLTERIWAAIGYLLVPEQQCKSFILFQGVPDSGKSVLGNFIRECFLGDVTTTLELNDLSGRFNLADLVGRKFCCDMDLPNAALKSRAISNLKKMTGSDPISSDVKFADRVKFENTAKFLFATNHAVRISGDDRAFLNRLVVIPFTRSYSKRMQNYQLPELLAAERDAVIVKALAAYQRLVANGGEFAGNYLLNHTLGFTSSADEFAAVDLFFQEHCEIIPNVWTPTTELHEAFVELYGPICEIGNFSRLLLQACCSKGSNVKKRRGRTTPGSNPVYGFAGLTLRKDFE